MPTLRHRPRKPAPHDARHHMPLLHGPHAGAAGTVGSGDAAPGGRIPPEVESRDPALGGRGRRPSEGQSYGEKRAAHRAARAAANAERKEVIEQAAEVVRITRWMVDFDERFALTEGV